jgi:hypothetical protein
MSILFNTNLQRPYDFVHKGRPSTFNIHCGKGVLLFSALDTHEELLLADHLATMKVPTAMIPMPLAPETTRLALGERQSLVICDEEISLDRIGSVWFLCNMDRPMPAGANRAEHEFELCEWRTAIWAFRGALQANWVNDPFRSGVLRLSALNYARSLGLRTPRTLITNHWREAVRFHDQVGSCVVKRVGHAFPSLENGDIFGLLTRRLTEGDLSDPERFSACPVLIQEEIPKRYEYRVYVVGNDLLAFRLHVGQALDWREMGAFEVRKEYAEMEEATKKKIRDLVWGFGLAYAAVDFVEDPAGTLYFLEINPNGTFEFCDRLVNPSISERICTLLVSGLA